MKRLDDLTDAGPRFGGKLDIHEETSLGSLLPVVSMMQTTDAPV